MMRETVGECIAVIEELGAESLERMYTVQGNERSEYDILLQVSEHLSYHTGQFAWFCKYLFHGDIDFYKGWYPNLR